MMSRHSPQAPSAKASGISLTLEPGAPGWASRLRPPPETARAKDTRRVLGLPIGTPVVMGGHQPGFWHPGILAKLLAVSAFTIKADATPAWIVVDQSPGAAAELPYPARGGDEAALRRESVVFGRGDTPPAAQPATRPLTPNDGATEAILAGLTEAAELMASAYGDISLAAQVHEACVRALMRRGLLSADTTPRVCYATDLHTTRGFVDLLDAMRQDPAGCARHYNEATARFPEAGVRPLRIADGQSELPLWERSGEAGPWNTVTSARLPDLPDEAVVLRGLPMTGLLRRDACDLFVHGTGGGASRSEAHAGYDRVTEAWFAGWLGESDLAPSVVATATQRLDFSGVPGASDLPTPAEIAESRALAHRATHDPTLLGDTRRGALKRSIADRIARLPRGSRERLALYREMHALRDEALRENTAALGTLRARARDLAGRLDTAKIADDRAWSFLFHADEALRHLQSAVREAFGGEGE